MSKLFTIGLTLVSVLIFSITANAFSFWGNDNTSTDISSVVKDAIGPYDKYSSEYGNKNSSGDAYINILSTNIGIVDKDMGAGLEEFVAIDRARTSETYLGQFNIINQTMSFCGLNGAVWGYHIAKVQDVVDKENYEKLTDKEKAEKKDIKKVNPLLMIKRDDGAEIPVYQGDQLIDAGRRLVGIKEDKRFPVLPGAEVKCAQEKYISSGPKYIWSSVALCIAEDRNKNANLFIENAGELVARDKEHIKEFEKDLLKDISHAAVRFGKDNNILFKEIWVATRIKWIPKGRTGCALTLVPYINLAKKAVPESGAEKLSEMSIDEWEKELQLSPLPEFDHKKNGFLTEYINFETREIEGASQSAKVAAKIKPVDVNAWAPMQIGFFKDHYPPAEEYPNIYGLRIGLPITYDDGSSLFGLDLSAFFSATSLVKGLQLSVVGTQTKDLDGVQISIANFIKDNINGIQIGGVNCSKQTQGLQFGFVNYSENIQGVQLGLVNVIKNGWLPFSIILNFDF